MDNVIILGFITLTIFSLMFAIGLNHSFEQLTFLWSRPALLLRSLLAVIVLVPVVVGLLLRLFDLPPAVATGLAVLAAAPGPPLMYKRTEMAGGDPDYAASLQLTLALLAILVTPLILVTFGLVWELISGRVTAFNVAAQVGQVTFLPVIIGLLIQRLAPGLAARIARPVRVISNVLLILLVLLLIALLVAEPNLRAMLWLGVLPTFVIITMGGASLAIGHLLSGPPQARRSVLAIAGIARNMGLALYIANLSGYGKQFVPTLLSYMVLGALLAVPYSVWSKRRLTLPEAA
ncbi:MAG: bile acid:sodium symporter [Syntrophobacteraceae bacterium]|jgi:BASS family bile acid:Na+ symporter|nr:bile acid:sodium symporter [Syntrophobacteraceae bacterium]